MKMNIDTNKYYNHRQRMIGKRVDKDGYYGCQCWMACQELNAKGYNTTTYGVSR